MKIALISLNNTDADPPLGLAYLSSYLKKYSEINEITIIDKGDILRAIRKKPFDIIGITAMTTDFKKANECAESIKKIMNVPLVVGGIHITIMPEHLKESSFDIGIIGEGEQTFLELALLLKAKGRFEEDCLKTIKGLVFKGSDGNIVYTPPRGLIRNLDEIPFPDREILKMKQLYLLPQIKSGTDNIGIFTTMFTSRGCPYSCKFCSSSSFWQRGIRFNSPEYVFNEIEHLINTYHVEGIHILDDLFVVDKVRVKKIVDKLVNNGLNKKVRFSLLLRTDLVTEDLLKDLKRMNVTHIGFGFESGSPKMLNYLKGKAITVEHHKKAILLSKKFGFKVSGSFLMGCPHETKEDMEMTLEFIRNNPLDQMNINQLVPMPKTEIWEYAKSQTLVNDSFEFTINRLSSLFVSKYNPRLLISQDIGGAEFKKLFFEAQELVKSAQIKNCSVKLSYLKYLKNPRSILKILRRWKRVLFILKFKKEISPAAS